MYALRRLNKYLFKYRIKLLWGFLFVVLSTILQALPAQVVRYAIDLVIDNLRVYQAFEGSLVQENSLAIFSYGVLVCVVIIFMMALLRGIFLYMVRQTIIVMSRLIEYDLKNEIFKHYESLPLSFYRENKTGDLMNRISEDVTRVRMYLGPSIMYGLQLSVLFLVLIPIMFSISPLLTWYSLAPLPVLSFGIYFVNTIIEKQSERIQRIQSRLSTFTQEAFSGIRVLKSFNKEKESVGNFAKESKHYMQEALRLTRVQSLFFPLITGLIGLSTVLVVYAGGTAVIDGSLTFGNIAEFIIYGYLLTWPVASLGWISSLTQRAEASQKRINEFLDIHSPIVSGSYVPTSIKGKVTFQNVSFIYDNTGIEALKDVSFSVETGECLAIIGTTGSGKSTIANIIGRLYDVNDGEVLIDDVNIKQYDLPNLRSKMGFVAQEVFLFNDTVYDNIGFGVDSPDEEKVKQSARDADVYDNIVDFKQGFGTVLGERGVMLSGGQKQRIAIARAFIRSPQILILDDSLSAVDTETEYNILDNMSQFTKTCTTIIISHRVSSARLAHKILVLHEGCVVEKGSHQQLYDQKGIYFNIYKKQMKETFRGQVSPVDGKETLSS